MVKTIIVWILAAFFAGHSIFTTLRNNYTTGLLLMWIITAMLVVYGIWGKHIDAFCAEGLGRVLKYLFFLGVAVFVGLFIFVAVSGYTDGPKGDEKSIVVLGAGLHGERISDTLRRRLSAALETWETNQSAVIVVTGGQGPQEDIPEAVAMRRWLLENGVPDEKILVEDKSTSTEENLTFAMKLLEEHGISAKEPTAVVTNAFHCYRAASYAEKLGFADVRTVPASVGVATVLPSYMREVLAVLYMWVFKRQLA
ncbi:YdcF family protein [Clostridia bacterium OttesenSCG-928-O13]|nr:YdcF family protein [Clostridia bacterium OttesenSCG-928-O13]